VQVNIGGNACGTMMPVNSVHRAGGGIIGTAENSPWMAANAMKGEAYREVGINDCLARPNERAADAHRHVGSRRRAIGLLKLAEIRGMTSAALISTIDVRGKSTAPLSFIQYQYSGMISEATSEKAMRLRVANWCAEHSNFKANNQYPQNYFNNVGLSTTVSDGRADVMGKRYLLGNS
jgi:hypothetical protein